MKYILHLVLVFLLTSLPAFAQLEIDKLDNLLLKKQDSLGLSSYKGYINLSGDFYVNSNAITNSFVNKFGYQRNFIEETMKDLESSRLKRSNRLGLDESAYLQGLYKLPKATLVFGIGQREFAGARFTSDLFELIFRGNSSYAGKDAKLGKTSLEYISYQSIYGGVQKEIKDGKFTIGASLAVLRGRTFQSLKMKSMNMYTDVNGQYIDLNGDLNYSKIPFDTGSSALKSNGMGTSVNLFFSMKQKNNRLNVEIRDIGFLHWKGVKTYYGDSTFQYNGVLIDDLLKNGVNSLSTLTADSIAISTGLKIKEHSLTKMLPMVVHINYVMSPNRKFSRTIGMRYMLAPGYIPRVYMREADFLGKGFTLVNTFSYGGFGRLDYEIGLLKKFKNSFVVSLNVFAFEYLVLPKKSSGNGFNVGLTKLF